jgi:hypothetical protein
MARPLLLVSPRPAEAARLAELLRPLPVRVTCATAGEAEQAWEARVRAVALEQGCVLLDPQLEDAELARLARAAAAAGAAVLLLRDLPLPAPGAPLGERMLRAHARVIDPGFLALLHQARDGGLGALERVVVRAPAGRRLPRRASRRSAFAHGPGVRFELRPAEQARLTARAAELWALADALVPGVGEVLELSEICADAAAGDRLVAHGRHHGVYVELELDDEMLGEGPLEIEASCARGALLGRFARESCGVVRRTAGGAQPVAPSERSALHAALRHWLARAPGAISPISVAAAERAKSLVRSSLGRAPSRAHERPLALVLVHLPRLRHGLDALRMPSLALARLAAFVRGHGFATELVDLEAEGACVELGGLAEPRARALALPEPAGLAEAAERLWGRLGPAIAAAKRDGRSCLVGFSVTDFHGDVQTALAASLARRAKSRAGCATVLGGERDQIDGPAALAVAGAFDFVVEGDGEAPLLGLCHMLAYGDRRASDVPGVWARPREGEPPRPQPSRTHLDAMPCPDFDGVPLEHYRAPPSAELLRLLAADGLGPGESPEPFAYLPYAFVKGCPARCAFCSAKHRLDVQHPEKSVHELLRLAERHAVRDFVLLNNLVNVGPRYLERFCRLLIDARAGLQWTDSCRPTGISAELGAAMREAGCLLLNFGVESGSDRILGRMRKGFDAASIVRTLRATHRAGILNRVNLIAGYLHEREDDVQDTLRLLETLRDEIDLIGCFQGFYLFPGMELDAREAGIALRGTTDRLVTGQLTVSYDELGGPRWEQKRETIEATRRRILAHIDSLGIRSEERIREHDLFYLGRRFEKARLKHYLFRSSLPVLPAPEAGAGRKPGGLARE